jgi:ribosomal protein S18 acetylase RimI-like enzyme
MALLIESMLKPLSWDSAHFGVAVARIEPADIDDRTLHDLLAIARRRQFALVYWAAQEARKVHDDILREFSGSHVDQKATYAIDLESWNSQDPGACRAGTLYPADTDHEYMVPDPWSAVRILEYPRGPAAAPLLELGRAAGAFSRFVNDPRIPLTKANELFEIWTQKSTLGEMADVVFVAQRADSPGHPLGSAIVGMVTVRAPCRAPCTHGRGGRQDGGQIGLIAVDPNVRGSGIGTALVHSANCWIVAAGLPRGWVVTQRANTAACRLYERSGYRLRQLEEVYHFWPLG